jgi:RHS repeat-associated protein
MYVSNESPTLVDVYFDDVVMTHTKGNVVQYNEYYPFGMQTANSWTRENTTGNNFLGNGGTELNQTSQLYDLDYRNYDPILGRMNGVDPMATKYASLSPYNFSFNDPVTFTDPSGADPEYPYQPYMGGQGGFYGYGSYYTYDDYIPQRDLGAFIPAVDKGRTGYRPFGHSMNFGLSESSVDFIKQMRADRFHLSDLQFIATYGMEVEIWEHGKDYKSANDNSWQFHHEYYYFKAVVRGQDDPRGDKYIERYEQMNAGAYARLLVGTILLENGIGGDMIASAREMALTLLDPNDETKRFNEMMSTIKVLVTEIKSQIPPPSKAAAEIKISVIGLSYLVQAEGMFIINEFFNVPRIRQFAPSYYEIHIEGNLDNGTRNGGNTYQWDDRDW